MLNDSLGFIGPIILNMIVKFLQDGMIFLLLNTQRCTKHNMLSPCEEEGHAMGGGGTNSTNIKFLLENDKPCIPSLG